MRDTVILNKLREFKNNLKVGIGGLNPISSLKDSFDNGISDLSESLEDLNKVSGKSQKTLKEILKNQIEANKKMLESNEITNDKVSSETALTTKAVKSTNEILKNLSDNSNKSLNILNSSFQLGLNELITSFQENSAQNNLSLEEQRKSFENLQKLLSDSNEKDKSLVKQLLEIDSKTLDFSEDSQKKLQGIFQAIQSDLNDEKLNTTLVNLNSSLELSSMRDEKILDMLKPDKKNKDDEDEDRKAKRDKDTNFTKDLLNSFSSMLGLGGLGGLLPLLGSTVSGLYKYTLALPKLTANLYSKLSNLSTSVLGQLKSGLDWIKGMGGKGIDLAKDAGSKGLQFAKTSGSKLMNFIKGAGSKGANFSKNLFSKIGSSGAKALGLGAVAGTALYDAGQGFAQTEKIMGKEGKEFGTLDILNAGGVNALTMGGLLGDPSKLQKQIEGAIDSFTTEKLPNNPSKTAKENALKNVKSRGDLKMLGRPLKKMLKTSSFGWRTHPKSGKWKLHRGVDYGTTDGTPIYAPFDGKVSATYFQKDGAGIGTEITHPDGLVTKYFHQSKRAVQDGDIVKTGQVIGYTGNTGASTGGHLHWETWLNGNPVDPEGLKYNFKPSGTSSVPVSKTGKGGIGGDNFSREELEMFGNYSFKDSRGLNIRPIKQLKQQSFKITNNTIQSNVDSVLTQTKMSDILAKIPDSQDLINQKFNELQSNIPDYIVSSINGLNIGQDIKSTLEQLPAISGFIGKAIDKFIPKDLLPTLDEIGKVLPEPIKQGLSGFVENTMDFTNNLVNSLPTPLKDLLPQNLNDVINNLVSLPDTFNEILSNPLSLVNKSIDVAGDLLFKNEPVQTTSQPIFDRRQTKANNIEMVDVSKSISDELRTQKPYLEEAKSEVVQSPKVIPVQLPSESPKSRKSLGIDDFHLALVTSGYLD